MEYIKILVNGTNDIIKRTYFKYEKSQSICYVDNPSKNIRMVNMEDGFAYNPNNNNELIVSPSILKIRGIIVSVRMNTDKNLILIDSIEVSTQTSYTTYFEPYKNTNLLIYVGTETNNNVKKNFFKNKENFASQSFASQSLRSTSAPRSSASACGLPSGWTVIPNGNNLKLIDIAFDGGADESATHNLYAISSDHKFYQLNIKLDGSVNAPITGDNIWSELTGVNNDLSTFFTNGFGSTTSSPMLSAYGGVLILNFYSSSGLTLPIFIPINRGTPDWISIFPLVSSDDRFKLTGVNWPNYVRIPPNLNSNASIFANPMIFQTPKYSPLWIGGKIGIVDQNVQGIPLKSIITTSQLLSTNPQSLAPGWTSFDTKKGNFSDASFLQNTSQNKGWGEINNVFFDSTNFILDSQSLDYQSNGIILIDWQDSSYRHIDYWTFNRDNSISNLGTIQIPMGLGVLQFAAFNGIMFCLTTGCLAFMRYTDTLDGTTPLANARCCETGECESTAGDILTNQLNIWTDCPSGQVCSYTGNDTCSGPAPPGPKPTPTPTPKPSPSSEGFFTKIWNWIKEHWIISLTSVAVLILIFALIIFIAMKSSKSNNLSGQFNQSLELLEQQKLASLLAPSSTTTSK